MKPAEFAYHRPDSVEEAVGLLGELDEAKVLGGGQSLLPILNMRLAAPAHLIDITGIRALRRFDEEESGVRYGAVTTHMMIEDGLVPDPARGLLSHAAAGIGYRAVRNRGTIAGSLAHSDSSAEWPAVLSALGAAVQVRSNRGNRRIPVRELLLGFFTTALAEDELITAVEVPRLRADTRWGMIKLARKPGEFAESLAITLVRPGETEIWLGAARDVPVRLPETEAVLAGGPIALDRLAEAVGTDTGSEGYERQRHAVAVRRALETALGETVRGDGADV
ncbi:FAD binding domain-containing protein [Sciscionella sediminilitoris]|uniref:FAD binding domain-containing protein n=1 Tax=Sciscionella sediminilitoris TaxID=1445613 RepID=UPI0004DF2807|nr:FAD binding domain-containing protein [Sciscionella sp. SE31]